MSEGACTCGIKKYCSDLYHKCLLFHSYYHFTYPKCPTTIYPTQPHPPSFYVSSSGYCVVVIHVLITILPIPKCTTTLPSDCHQPYPAHLLFSLVHFSSAVFSFHIQSYRVGSCPILFARSISFSMIVTRLVWMAQRLVSSNSPTSVASEAS